MESPQSLGRYDLTAHLARGGMADVFEATDRMLDRRVAVKILHQRYADTDTFVARFRKEAQAAANLSHPNIVSVYDWGEEEDTYFIVMELVKGRSLRDVVRSEGRILPRRAAEIATEVSSALEVAHRNRVIHRDIKPGNIMLAEDGTVKVTDFGVARAWDDSQDLTKTGAVIGTATYFSPEQARGDPADERSDIYSLGVVLYEMLVGRPPFSGETPVSVAYQHVTAEVPPPSRLNSDVPLELEDIVMRSLAKDPARRYRTAADIRRDLLLFLQGRPPRPTATAQPPPTPAQVVRRPDLPPPTVSPDEAYRRVHATPRQPSQLPFVITSIALAAGVVFGVYVLLNSFSNEPPAPTASTVVTTREVPDVLERPQDEALQMLQEAGFRVTQENEAAEAEIGTVIRTVPEAGTLFDVSLFVAMVVSSGPAQIQVPTVVGSTQERAIAQLEGQGFVVPAPRTVRHESVGAGLVVSQAPPAGAIAPAGSTVELVVSAGPEPIEMPRVIGLTRDRAEGMLDALGLEVETTTALHDDVEEGYVINQSPSPGADMNPGGRVQIVVSEGREEIELQELSGRPISEVTALLQESGMEVVTQQENSLEVAAGVVIRTEPPGGTVLTVGDQVQIVVSEGREEIELQELSGRPIGEVTALLQESGMEVVTQQESSLEVAAGVVIRTEPPGGTVLTVGDQVTVVESTGPRFVAVPDLTGSTPDDARVTLAALGLRLEVADSLAAVSDLSLDGRIARQAPKPGDEVLEGETVLAVLGEYTPPVTNPEEGSNAGTSGTG